MHKVGTKGQVVIEKRIREHLNVQPGCRVIQRISDSGRVELEFLPPPSTESLKGRLAPFVKRHDVSTEQLREGRDKAWREQASRDETTAGASA